MIKKSIVLISLSLMTVSVVAALNPNDSPRFAMGVLNPNDFPEEDREAAFALLRFKKEADKRFELKGSVLRLKKDKNRKASKGEKPKPSRKKRANPLGSTVSDAILKYAYKNYGESVVLLTLLEQTALKEMLRTKIDKEPGGKPVCLLCDDTRVTYEKMASHIACKHGGVQGWKESPEAPFYSNYTGFASSLEMKKHK